MKLTIACILTVALIAVAAVLAPPDKSRVFDSRTFGLLGGLKEITVWGFYIRENEQEDQRVVWGSLPHAGKHMFPDDDACAAWLIECQKLKRI